MLVDMITAEQARTKVYIEIMNADLRYAKKHIMNGISRNECGVAIDQQRFINPEATIAALKELGYRVRQCPEENNLLFIQWEEPAADNPQVAFTWDEL